MRLLMSILFMGFISTGTALRPKLPRKDVVSRTREDRLAAALEALDRLPLCIPADVELPVSESPQPDVAALVRHFEQTQHRLGRLLLRLRVLLCRLESAFMFDFPELQKRMLDILASSIMLVLLSPLFLLIGILVKLEDGGPIFFAQTRVGRHGRRFRMYKVRSMCLDAEARLQEVMGKNRHSEGITFKLKDDPRITRIGKYLRKFSMDELPQFYNVLKGDMSLVGPRPPVPREVAQYTLADRRRLEVKPGITCIWQVSGRSEIDFSGQVELDVRYIENRDLWLDLKLLCLTIPAVISGKGAC